MRSALRLLLLLAAVLSGPPAAAATTFLDPVAQELSSLRDGLDPGVKAEAKLVKTIDKLLASLQSVGPATPLASELKIAAKTASTVEKRLAGRGDLAGLLAAAVLEYRALVENARERISVAIALMPLEPKARGSLAKSLSAIDRGLASLTPAASPSYALKAMAKIAKYVASTPSLPESVEATWVTNSISVAPATEGVDLDGDGTIDNQLGALAAFLTLLGFDIDPLLATAVTGSPNVLLIQMWWSESEGGVLAGMVNGLDDDGDLGDNFSGEETFVVTAGLDSDDHPLGRVATSFSPSGGYATELFDAGGISLPGLDAPLPEFLPLALKGTASAAQNTGYLGFAIPVEILAAALVAMGQPDYTTTLRTLADIDLDPGTPGNEGLSSALEYTAVPAGIR